MNMVIAWLALLMTVFLALGSMMGPHHYSILLVACPIFLASAAGGFGLFDKRSTGLLLLTSVIAGIGAIGSVIAINSVSQSALEMMLSWIASGGFVCIMLFSLKLHELAKEHVSDNQKHQQWLGDLKKTDEPQFEHPETEQTTNAS
jgi:peptidoglycan/LPS O-acetylase OafA/YrhL